MNKKLTQYIALALLSAPLAIYSPQPASAEPFQLGVEQRGQGQTYAPASSGGYYTPQAIQPIAQPMQQRPPIQGNANSGRIQGGAQQNRPPAQRPPMQATVQAGTLPPAFMGSWLVQGQRTKVQGKTPEFQQNAEQNIQVSTRNIWNISGNPQQGYKMSNDQGVQTPLQIRQVQGAKAIISYQHPVFNVMAQEMIIMELQNGGANFAGVERMTISKPGEQGPPRCTVTYSLSGQRQ